MQFPGLSAFLTKNAEVNKL